MLILAGLPFVAATLQTPEPGDASTNNPPAATTTVAPQTTVASNSAPADAAVAVIVTNVPPASPTVSLSKGVAEVVRLAQSGVDESVLLAYIGSVNSQFNVGSDQILYLNDIGISSNAIKAMMDRDVAIDAAARDAYAATPPDTAQPPMVDTNLPADYSANPMPLPDTPPDVPAVPVDVGANPGDYVTTDDYGAFYGSLAPYGSWIYLAGCGYCWQPTVCVRDYTWRPYCDRGRWINSDCGWYWQSDYSWGWAAFHYGRWFHHEGRGWCWAPDRVWGPAWVNWRRSEDHCGWAPLPPSARFAPGSGFHVGGRAVNGNSDFGLSARNYVFIPTERMTDYAPNRYTVSSAQRAEIFNHSTIENGITVENHRVINHGIDPRLVAAASGVEVRRAEIHEMPAGGNNGIRPDRLDKQGDTFTILRPQFPVSPVHRTGSDHGGASSGGRVTSTVPGQGIALPGRNSGAPRTTASDPSRGSANPQPVLGAQTTSPFTPAGDPGNKPRVQVWVRPDAAKPEAYPPNSLVLSGRRNNNNLQPSDSSSVPHMNAAGPASQPVQPASTPNVLLPFRSQPPVQAETHASQPAVPTQGYYRETPNGWAMPTPQQPPLALPSRASGYSQPNYQPARNQQYTQPVTPAVTYSRPNYTPPPAYSAPQPRYSEPAPAQTYHQAPAYTPPPSYQAPSGGGGSGGSSASSSSSHSSSSSSSSPPSLPSRGR